MSTNNNNKHFHVSEEFRGPFVGYTLGTALPREKKFAEDFKVNSVRYRGPFEGTR